MIAPRLEIDLDKIEHNARTLVERLKIRRIAVTGVTKAALGSPTIASRLLRAGVSGLGDSRIENIERMRRAGMSASMTLIRSPMLSQVDRVAKSADISFNSELDVVIGLSSAAHRLGRTHGVVLMVELGDLREGIMPADLPQTVREILNLPNITLRGIGTNLACRSGVSPDARNMSELSALANSVEETFGLTLDIVSGGNSANLNWALSDTSAQRINDLRLGESILLGREPLHRTPIDGLYTDAITLIAEVIESKVKPSKPWGIIAQSAFGTKQPPTTQTEVFQSLLAIGEQDTDPYGLVPADDIQVLGASSDHLIVDSGWRQLPLGTELTFQPNYSALVRAMTSSFVGSTETPPKADAVGSVPK